jgi:hypothetical protein
MRSTEHLPAVTSAADRVFWFIVYPPAHPPRQRAGAGDRGRSEKYKFDQHVTPETHALCLLIFPDQRPRKLGPCGAGMTSHGSIAAEPTSRKLYCFPSKRGIGLIPPFAIAQTPKKYILNKMPWLLQLLIDALIWLVPWVDRHTDRSIVGESRFDRQARWIAWILLSLIVASLLFYFLIFNK